MKDQFTTVTIFSKYLALTLFITLPIAGFILGMKYSKEMSILQMNTNEVEIFVLTKNSTTPVSDAIVLGQIKIAASEMIDMYYTNMEGEKFPIIVEDLGGGYYRDESDLYFDMGYSFGQPELRKLGYHVDGSEKLLIFPEDNCHNCSFLLLKKGVIYGGEEYTNIDKDSFKHVSGDYFMDAKHVYVFGLALNTWPEIVRIQEADVDTFEVYKENKWFGLDSKYVYGHGRIIPLADPITFHLLKGSTILFSADKNNVYLQYSLIENMSPENFEVVGRVTGSGGEEAYYVKDTYSVWYVYDTSDRVFSKFKAVQLTDVVAEVFSIKDSEVFDAFDGINYYRWGEVVQIR